MDENAIYDVIERFSLGFHDGSAVAALLRHAQTGDRNELGTAAGHLDRLVQVTQQPGQPGVSPFMPGSDPAGSDSPA